MVQSHRDADANGTSFARPANHAPARPGLAPATAGRRVLRGPHRTVPLALHAAQRLPHRISPRRDRKVAQILSESGTRNFRHPQLLLESTQLAADWLGVRREPQSAVLVGRWISAIFSTIAIAALAWCGYRAAGLWGLLIAGLGTALCPSLLVYSHYMKEDAALVMGICLTVWALRLVFDSRTPVAHREAIVLTGLACALAASAKYAGFFAPAAAVPLVLASRPRQWKALVLRVVLVLIPFVALWAAVNYRIFTHLSPTWDAFNDEWEHSVTAHNDGLTMARPNSYFVDGLVSMTLPPVLVLAGLFIVLTLVRIRRITLWEITVIGLPVAYLVALSFTVLPFYRYLLPVIVLVHFMAALALLRIVQLVRPRWRFGWLAAPATVGLIVAMQLPRCLDFLDQFENDSRTRLRQWIATNIAPGAGIVADDYTALRAARTPQNVWSNRFAPDADRYGILRTMGASYVAVADLAYSRYFDPHIMPAKGFEQTYRRHKDWYQELDGKYDLIWESAPAHPTYAFTNPTIKLYRKKSAAPGS